MMSTLSVFLYGIFCLCVGLLIGHSSTKAWYKGIINTMIIKNQHLTERVKKLILIISPDDIDSQKPGE
jgi:hypothetical protein